MKGIYVSKNAVNISIREGTEINSYMFRDTPAEKFVKFLKRNDPVTFSVKEGTRELTFCSKIKDPAEFPQGFNEEDSKQPPAPAPGPAPAPAPMKYDPIPTKKVSEFVPASQVKSPEQVQNPPKPMQGSSAYVPDDATLVAMSVYSDGYWKAKFLKDIRVSKEIRAQAALNTATKIVTQWQDADRMIPNELGQMVMEVATDLQAYVVLSSHGDVDETLEDWVDRMRTAVKGKAKPKPEPIPEPIPEPVQDKKQDEQALGGVSPKKPEFEGKVITNIPKSSGNYNGDNRTDMDQGEMDFVDDSYLAGC